jgi:hypothetical protein
MKQRTVHYFVISAFTILYVITSLISTIHVVDFFALSNPQWLAIGLAIAFEVGAAASLASIIALQKMNKTIVWGLFILLTAMQAMGNTYYAYSHLKDFQGWIELFGLVDEELIYQKRMLGIVSGAILPVVALGFIKALVDYIKPDDASLMDNHDFIHADSPKLTTDEVTQLVMPVTTDAFTTTMITTTESPIVNIEKVVHDQIPISSELADDYAQTADEPQLNNLSHDEYTRTVDEKVSRGERPPEPFLKKPHDP